MSSETRWKLGHHGLGILNSDRMCGEVVDPIESSQKEVYALKGGWNEWFKAK